MNQTERVRGYARAAQAKQTKAWQTFWEPLALVSNHEALIKWRDRYHLENSTPHAHGDGRVLWPPSLPGNGFLPWQLEEEEFLAWANSTEVKWDGDVTG